MTNYIWEVQTAEGFFKVIAKNVTKIKTMLDAHGLSDRLVGKKKIGHYERNMRLPNHRLVKIDEPRFLKPKAL